MWHYWEIGSLQMELRWTPIRVGAGLVSSDWVPAEEKVEGTQKHTGRKGHVAMDTEFGMMASNHKRALEQTLPTPQKNQPYQNLNSDSALQNSERIHFCSFKLPSFSWFAMAVQQRTSFHSYWLLCLLLWYIFSIRLFCLFLILPCW